MYKLLFIAITCFITAVSAHAQFSLTVVNPQLNSNSGTQGIITSPEITVTPNGAYAQVEMIFTINPQTTYKATDSLEAVMTFELPAGSFMHDSWLWLNETVIIRAAMVERNRAISIYEGIVKRRRDPSLLYKTGGNSYKLHVYPMTTAYPRKVKLVYSTPMKWQNNKVLFELPMKMFTASQLHPDVVVKVNTNGYYTTPSFADNDYNRFFVGQMAGTDALIIRGNDYKNASFNLQYIVNTSDIQLFTYPINATEGIYQLVIPPATFGVNKSINTAFILDHVSTVSAIYTFEQIKQQLKTTLLTNYSDRDSFNIFYESNGSIVNLFNSWQHIDKANVEHAINSLPAGISGMPGQYENLIKTALGFCSSKNNDEAEVVLISNNMNYTNNQSAVDGMFNNIKSHLGGTFKNKVHVLNYSPYKANFSGTAYNANDIWYTKLTLATGGLLYKFNTLTYGYVNGTYTAIYDLNAANALFAIANNAGSSTVSYKIGIDVLNGFTFGEYNLNSVNRLNMSKHYVETGKYSGSMAAGVDISIVAMSGQHSVNLKSKINTLANGDATFVPAWSYHYIKELVGQNNSAYTQEIIDSSISSRVLCEYTAFLAVETGDTLNTNINDNPKYSIISNDPGTHNIQVKCYPNPFSDALTIEFGEDVRLIEIYDILGRKVFSNNVMDKKKSYTWNGKDTNGNALPAGMYMVVGATATERYTVKVMKQ